MALVTHSWRHGGIVDLIQKMHAIFGKSDFINLDVPVDFVVPGHHNIPRYLHSKGALKKTGKRELPDGRVVIVWRIRDEVIEYLALLEQRTACPHLHIKETGGAWCLKRNAKCNMNRVRVCLRRMQREEDDRQMREMLENGAPVHPAER